MIIDHKDKFPDPSEGTYVRQQVERGQSLTSAQERQTMDKYQGMEVTEKPHSPKVVKHNVSDEDKILNSFIKHNNIIFHKGEDSHHLEDMNIKLKMMFACYLIKYANWEQKRILKYEHIEENGKGTDALTKRKNQAIERRDIFMNIFTCLEDHLKEEYSIVLPEKKEDIKSLGLEIGEDNGT